MRWPLSNSSNGAVSSSTSNEDESNSNDASRPASLSSKTEPTSSSRNNSSFTFWASETPTTPPSSSSISSPSTSAPLPPLAGSHDEPQSGPQPWSLAQQLTSPPVLVSTVILTGALLGVQRLYFHYLRRVREARNISASFWGRRSLLGQVTSVGDGDGFRIYHTPGGLLAGWGLVRKVPTSRTALKANTISIRLAGVDAPEAAHFGHAGQPGGQEAWDWLKAYLLGERVRVHVWRRDQYERAVGTVYRLRYGGLVRTDVGLKMLRCGLATVYDAKTGAEFGGLEEKYRRAEAWAKWWRRGIWSDRTAETPRQFKDRLKKGSGLDSG